MKWLFSREKGFLSDKHVVCKNMILTEYIYSSRDYIAFTVSQVSLSEVYKTKVIP